MPIKIGIDIGGTKISGAIFDYQKLICSHLIIYDKNIIFSKELLEKHVYKTINSLLEKSSLSLIDVEFVGIACTGVIDSERNMILNSANLNLHNIAIQNMINEKIDMSIFNDAFANAFGEFLLNEKEFHGKKTLILAMGTGVGSSIIESSKSKLQFYTNMELGHIVIEIDGIECTCGRKGCLNMYISSNGIAKIIFDSLSQNKIDRLPYSFKSNYELIDKLFQYGIVDYDYSSQLINTLLKVLEIGILNCANAYFPDTIILSGGLSKYYTPFLCELENDVNIYSLKKNIQIKTAKDNDTATWFGAANLDQINNYIT
jgi:glucokinase